MKKAFLVLLAPVLLSNTCYHAGKGEGPFPSTEISNDKVHMKLYLPDKDKGYYRATRFDWSGIIASLTWNGHEYFGQWKTTHDPLVHEDLSGPVEASVQPGPGYDQAPFGGTFVRLGVGVLEKPHEKEFHWDHTYRILDPGKWTVTQGKDWIGFRQEISSPDGYAYVYTKKITLKEDEPGFIISHTLQNTGTKTFEVDQFNHNFFMIDGEPTGRNFVVSFPYNLTTENDTKGIVKLEKNEITFLQDLDKGSVWLELQGYSDRVSDHAVSVVNKKTGAGIKFHVDKPLYKQVFWACPTTLCPENFILLHVEPGQEESWNSDYTLFEEGK